MKFGSTFAALPSQSIHDNWGRGFFFILLNFDFAWGVRIFFYNFLKYVFYITSASRHPYFF